MQMNGLQNLIKNQYDTSYPKELETNIKSKGGIDFDINTVEKYCIQMIFM